MRYLYGPEFPGDRAQGHHTNQTDINQTLFSKFGPEELLRERLIKQVCLNVKSQTTEHFENVICGGRDVEIDGSMEEKIYKYTNY